MIRSFIVGFLLSSLIYYHAFNLTVRYNQRVMKVQDTTMRAIGNTCAEWYELVSSQKNFKRRPRSSRVASAASSSEGQ